MKNLANRLCLLLAALIAAQAGAAAESKSEACESLRGVTLGHATVRTSVWFAGGDYRTGFASRGIPNVPAFCRAILTSAPVPASNITIEVWLPSEEVWNGKLLGSGNGGFGGAISVDALAAAVKRNYAGANTDMGTFPAAQLPNTGYDAGIGHPEMVKDWGYRSTHEMTIAAKALIKRYYSKQLSHSYLMGCSTGGHQALSEAQRYPSDYDGIIAGAAGHNRTHLHASFLQRFQQGQTLAPLFSPEKAELVSNTLLERCAGKNGGAPGDRFLSNPAACDFKPSQLRCANGNSAPCLSAPEVKVLETMYYGTRNPRTHELIYPGWAKGSEASLLKGLQKQAEPTKTGSADGVFRWVFGPQWDARTFDFDRDMEKEDAALGPTINALSADLSKFADHGGKLILFHGWADPVVSPYDSILYFDRLKDHSFVRLFMAPGMSHCRGGPGPDSFGQNAVPEGGADAAGDIVAALDMWVEKGIAPQTLIARKLDAHGTLESARPLCAYPDVAVYNGAGDAKSEKNYHCIPQSAGNTEFPAAKYLK
ncbi:MAG TPA: tannase/feruloyl esterase family alpha/beta hydrolase [Bryobacteraceae bacterium]|jgi:hypothetical protein